MISRWQPSLRRCILVLATLVLSSSSAVAQLCGNDAVEVDEECDDGNSFGGDGCAANCTQETVHQLGLRSVAGSQDASRSVIQSIFIVASSSLRGVIDVRVGKPRNSAVANTAGETFAAGDVPIVLRTAGTNLMASIPGFDSCFRLFEAPELGPGNVGAGRIACGAGGEATNYLFTIDSVTDMQMTTASGSGPRGSARISIRSSNTFGPGRGDDRIACTGDDSLQAPPVTLTFTTGSSEAVVQHANDDPLTLIASGSRVPCSGSACLSPESCRDGACRQLCGASPCDSGATGALVDCDRLVEGEIEAFFSTALVGAGALLNQPGAGDHTLYTVFAFGPPPTATPTATGMTASTSTPTATASATTTPTPTNPPPTATQVQASPSVTPTSGTCLGDCNGDGSVTVDEILRGVNIALGTLSLQECPPFDGNGDGLVTVDEIVRAVSNALAGCGS